MLTEFPQHLSSLSTDKNSTDILHWQKFFLSQPAFLSKGSKTPHWVTASLGTNSSKAELKTNKANNEISDAYLQLETVDLKS